MNNKLLVWTDGSCINQSNAVLRRAGVGVWFGREHKLNVSEPLLGEWQTAQRAELVAVVRALEQWRSEPTRPLVIHSDSAYAVLEVDRLLRPRMHKQISGERVNGDVLKTLGQLLLVRKADVQIVKVGRAANKNADGLARAASNKAYEKAHGSRRPAPAI